MKELSELISLGIRNSNRMLSIVIPAFNEEGNIRFLYREYYEKQFAASAALAATHGL